MQIWIWAFFGGIVGAVLMDITESYLARIGIRSGVNVALIGRWTLGLLRGQHAHTNILNSEPLPGEVRAGWLFHFLVGGGGVALGYPLFCYLTGIPISNNHLIGGLFFGLATSLLPWFVLMPSFGWGLFGRRGPSGANALLASTLSHIPYGLGVGAVVATGFKQVS
jgi:hypothetical protein